MNKQVLVIIILCQMLVIKPWSGTEATGEKPVFFGKLTSQEGNTFNVTNISIGRSRAAGRAVRLYELPRISESMQGKDTIKIPGNPHHDLTTTEFDLLKVKKVVVPSPQTSWIWEKPSREDRAPSTRYEFIQLDVTWKGDQTGSYLLELGAEHTTNPIKIFCDSTGNAMISAPALDGGPMFCTGVNQAELRKKGAPFPSIKELVVEGYCYEAPANGSGTVGLVKPKDVPLMAPAKQEPVQSTPDLDIQPAAAPAEPEDVQELEIEVQDVSDMAAPAA